MAKFSHRPTYAALLAALALLALPVMAADQSTGRLGKGSDSKVLKPQDLQAIAFNGDVTIAVGAAGTVMRSVDGGSTWITEILPVSAALIDVVACPDHSFVALDFYRRVWVGNSKGDAWQAAELPGEITPMAISCAPSGAYWVVGSYSTVLSSHDQGRSWLQREFGEDAQLTAIQFIDAANGFIAGEFGLVLRTVDGGATWQTLPRVPDEFYPFDAWFESAESGWLTGRGGKLLHTADSGKSWQEEANPVPGLPMYRLVAATGGQPFAVGELGVVLQRRQQRWISVGAKPLGGYLRGGVSNAADGLIVVGGGGIPTPVAITTPFQR